MLGLGLGVPKSNYVSQGFVQNGLLLNGVFSNQQQERCVTFEGTTNKYLYSTNAAYFDLDSDYSWTYGGWFFIGESTEDVVIPVNYPGVMGNADTRYDRNWSLWYNTVTALPKLQSGFKQTDGTIKYITWQTTELQTNAWRFIVARYTYTGDLSTSTLETIMYDEFGNHIETITYTGIFDAGIEQTTNASNRFYMGYHYFGADQISTRGTCMKDVWQFDKALTDDEIAEIYNEGLGKTYSDLQSSTQTDCRWWFPLTEATNTPRYDAVSNVPLTDANFVRQSAYWLDWEGTKRRYTMYGNCYLTGKGGYLNGNNGGFMVVPSATGYGINGQSYTIEIFVRVVEAGTYDVLWSNDYTSHSPPYYVQHLRYNGGSNSLVYITDNNVTRLADSSYPNNTLQQVVITCEDDGTGNKDMRMYTRRLSDGTVTYNSTTNATFTHTYYDQPVVMGSANFNGDLSGEIQGFRYYDRALSVEELEKNFEQQLKVN